MWTRIGMQAGMQLFQLEYLLPLWNIWDDCAIPKRAGKCAAQSTGALFPSGRAVGSQARGLLRHQNCSPEASSLKKEGPEESFPSAKRWDSSSGAVIIWRMGGDLGKKRWQGCT